jgi:hypothetical protein
MLLIAALSLLASACAPESLTDYIVDRNNNMDQGNITPDQSNNNNDHVQFAQVAQIMRDSCAAQAACHGSDTAFSPPRIANAGNATDEDVRAALEGVMSDVMAGTMLIAPGDPERSFLYRRMTDSRLGSIMPLGAPPLPESQLSIVRLWIEQGASYGDEEEQDMGDAPDMNSDM